MVSGLVTSPWDQLRIFSGEAREMRMESKSAIKFARSYGEDLKIASNIYLTAETQRSQRKRREDLLSSAFPRRSPRLCGEYAPNQPPKPYPALPAASSLIPHRDTAIAVRV